MAGVAIGFQLGMSVAERTRRYQPFHNRLARNHLCRKHQSQESDEADNKAHQYI
jgi:hypothetical protein